MSQSGLFKKRRGVGSIIAGAFIILIVLSSYEFYLLNNRSQNDYQKTLTNMRSFDIARTQEDLKFTDFAEDYSFVEVRNDGPELVHVTFVAIFVDGVYDADATEAVVAAQANTVFDEPVVETPMEDPPE